MLEGVAMTLQSNGVTWPRRTVLPQGSQGLDGTCPPAPPHSNCCKRVGRKVTKTGSTARRYFIAGIVLKFPACKFPGL